MNPATIEVTAPDISCATYKENVEGDMAGEPGIEQVTVEVGARRIRINYDPEQTNPGQLRDRLSGIGYPAAL
jgi:copper chaperone CopZ